MIRTEISADNTFEMKVHFNLKRIGGTRSQIWLVATIKRVRVKIYTGLLIEPKYWCQASGVNGERALESSSISSVANRENRAINQRLKEILSYCKEYGVWVSANNIDECNVKHNAFNFKQHITCRLKGERALERLSTEDYIMQYIERKRTHVNKTSNRILSSGTIYNHTNALNRVKRYCTYKRKRVVWELFNRAFEDDFRAWMNTHKYAPNTIASTFSIIKVWLKEAERDGLITDTSYKNYRTTTEEVDNIYLSESEIQRLYEIDFASEDVKAQIDDSSHIEETRDLFIVACWTALRFGDWHDLSSADFGDETMQLLTHKTRTKVTIPLHPMVKQILTKYGGRLPKSVDKTRTITQIQQCAQIAGIDEETTIHRTRGGRVETLRLPKYRFIVNHTARRSFATNMYLKQVPTQSIMAITGHTTEQNFLKYIKVGAEQHAEIVRRIGFGEE